MKFKIQRGTQGIGDSCVEIWTKQTRIVIDFGMPLVNLDKTQFNSNKVQKTSVNVLLKNGLNFGCETGWLIYS
jgi:ribonuclease J